MKNEIILVAIASRGNSYRFTLIFMLLDNLRDFKFDWI